MKTNEAGRAIVKEFEGCSLKPYLCPAGVWTIGFGHTDGVNAKTPAISKKEAEELLSRDLKTAENSVTMLVKQELNENQFSALVSFTYNLGRANFRNSTLLRLINSGDLKDAAEQFIRWNKVDGKEMDGLTRRRLAEKKLFLTEVV